MKFLLLVVFASVLTACGAKVYDEIDLMPSPTVFADARVDPFVDINAQNVAERSRLFYVTDREPADGGDRQSFYNNERGFVMRAGTARVQIDPPVETWDEFRNITLTEDRRRKYTLSLAGVNEFGVMPFSTTRYLENKPSQSDMDTTGRKFAGLIDQQLARSKNKDIFIYIHGYNVDFDYSTLVSKELQHFLGYQGAFISYNWTATPSRLAYFRDQESVLASRRYLRSLIEYLSDNTRARRIHLVGYSAGTRLAFEAAYQIALKQGKKPRMGRLILIGSDLDVTFVLQSLEDGLLESFDDVTFYQSQSDSALAVSRLVFGRKRIGQARTEGKVPPNVLEGLAYFDDLHVIDVTEAEDAEAGNGHSYYQSSPWASSDLFISLLSDRDPGERGLVRDTGDPVWRFPSNYPKILEKLTGGV